MTQHLLCWHARMPFSAENFIKNSELQSYAAEWLPSAESKGHAHPNFNQPLQAEPLAEITLDELVRFTAIQ